MADDGADGERLHRAYRKGVYDALVTEARLLGLLVVVGSILFALFRHAG